jgi:translin
MNKILFKKILNDYQRYIKLRESIIKSSRQVLKLSKQAIFNLHRDDVKNAADDLVQAENLLKEINLLFSKEKKLNYEGSYKECIEEYVEAKLFYSLISAGKIEINTKVKLNFDDYVGAISDLTGEMLRKAIQLATNEDYEKLNFYYQSMEDILGELIKFDFTGKLRMKYDAAKRNLRRLEEIKYELKIKGLN